jgi:hypothetical protein
MLKKIKIALSTFSPKLTTYLMFLYNFKRFPNLKNPKDLNEKLQYLKLKTYYDNPVITTCVDKWKVRNYLEAKGYGDLLPKLILGDISDPNDIRTYWNTFPDSFVIKCNHGCGYNILVKNKQTVDEDEIINQLDLWMKEDYWKYYCEPQYKDVPKRILVEEYLDDDIETYKFYCFNGIPKVVYISQNGENGEKDLYLDYYDMDWHHLDITLATHLHSKKQKSKPKGFEKMVKLSEELSKDFPFVRVDLYNIDGAIYFSELTFIPTGGNMKLSPKEVVDEWGELLKLPS